MIADAISSTIATSANSVRSGTVLKNPAAHPESLFPNAFDRIQTPIITPTMRGGDSLVTALRPTGYRHSSPSSEMPYATTSHHGLTRTPGARCAMAPAGTSTRNDMPMNTTPSAIFAGTDGSCLPRGTHIHANTGASIITKIGWTDWNHEEGNEKPNTTRRV